MDATLFVNHIEKELTAARNRTPRCRGTRLRPPLTDADLVVIKAPLFCGLSLRGKQKNGKHGNKHYHHYFF